MPFHVLVERIENDACTEFFPVEPKYGLGPKCPKCGQFVGSLPWVTPYRFKLDVWGNQYGDLAFGGPSLLISEHFKEVYQQNGLTGLNGFEPALLLKCQSRLRLKETSPNYLHVELHRGFTAIDEAGSEVVWEDPIVCRYCLLGSKLKRRRRIIIDESTWSGEDIFYARGLPGVILVSNRFKEVCEGNQIKNAIFVPSQHRR